MADDAADSTKSEDDSLEVGASDYKVSSSFNNTQTVQSSAQEYSPASSQDNGQTVSSTDTREHPVIQPSRLSGFWGHNSGMYSNPFVPKAPLRTDVVSTASSAGDERESIIAPGRLGAVVNREFGSGFSTTMGAAKSFQICPPVFSAHFQPNNVKAPLLKPAKLPDPTKINDTKADSAGEVEKDPSLVSERLVGAESEVSSSSSCSSPHPAAAQSETEGATAAEPCYNQEILANISKNNKLKDTSGVSSSSQSDFVFGKNLSQRVTGVSSPSLSQTAPSTFVFGENLTSKVILETNGSNESPQKDDSDSDSGKLNRTLEESAREYQAKHENKTELKEVERITGEEDESNVLQANAKLFLFDAPAQTWVERGRGTIRLNDRSSADTKAFQSRLVMRTQGSLRVVLNTKIWPGMTIERASPKSVRITAMDTDESIKVFLIMTNTKDSENLLRAIDWRIQQLKIQEEPSRLHSDPKTGEKRKANSDFEYPHKTKKVSSPVPESGTLTMKKDESDSSVQDPETEASCESHSSSLTIKSESD